MTSAMPVIDLRAASAGNTSQLGPVRAATEELGALQVINHGVAPDLIRDLRARTAELFSLPQAEKAKLTSLHPYRGWRQWPDDDAGRLELERFDVAQFDDIEAARAAGLAEEYLGLYTHTNMWPADDSGLREVAFRYIEAASGLAKRMLWLYAKAQGLRDTFALGTPLHLRLAVNDYPEGHDGPGPSADGDKLLEHADDSAVTILAREGDGDGLQIQAPDGSWLPVPVIPGALLVLSGSLLTQWTGGRMRAGRHRVAAGSTGTRRSTSVFVYPALDTVIAPLKAFAPLVADCNAEPILVWDHVKDRVAGR